MKNEIINALEIQGNLERSERVKELFENLQNQLTEARTLMLLKDDVLMLVRPAISTSDCSPPFCRDRTRRECEKAGLLKTLGACYMVDRIDEALSLQWKGAPPETTSSPSLNSELETQNSSEEPRRSTSSVPARLAPKKATRGLEKMSFQEAMEAGRLEGIAKGWDPEPGKNHKDRDFLAEFLAEDRDGCNYLKWDTDQTGHNWTLGRSLLDLVFEHVAQEKRRRGRVTRQSKGRGDRSPNDVDGANSLNSSSSKE